MIRARFHANGDDFRSVNWPIKHPYWCTGYGFLPPSGEICPHCGQEIEKEYSIVVAYADSVEEIKENWPEASNINVMEEGLTEYIFTDRFPKPDWMTEGKQDES